MHTFFSPAQKPLNAGPIMAPDAPPEGEIREALARVLASADFPASARNRRFLSFVVSRVLDGDLASISAYAIATEVFGRAAGFKPSEDPIVRVEAGKLRQDLETYYLKSGRGEPLRIEIPRGGYVPIFERSAPADENFQDSPSADASMQAELGRILGSTDFPATPRNRRFLAYLVERALDGDPGRIGAREIGTKVFGFSDTFDANKSPIVRVEASKLRRALETYYLKSGRRNPCRISIPKGRYRVDLEACS